MIENYKKEVFYLEILVYRLNNLISYLLENSDEATNLYEDYKAKKIDKNIKKDLEILKESEEYHRKGYADLYKKIDEAMEYIEDNFTNEDGTIWHEEIKKIYNILKGVDKE